MNKPKFTIDCGEVSTFICRFDHSKEINLAASSIVMLIKEQQEDPNSTFRGIPNQVIITMAMKKLIEELIKEELVDGYVNIKLEGKNIKNGEIHYAIEDDYED